MGFHRVLGLRVLLCALTVACADDAADDATPSTSDAPGSADAGVPEGSDAAVNASAPAASNETSNGESSSTEEGTLPVASSGADPSESSDACAPDGCAPNADDASNSSSDGATTDEGTTREDTLAGMSSEAEQDAGHGIETSSDASLPAMNLPQSDVGLELVPSALLGCDAECTARAGQCQDDLCVVAPGEVLVQRRFSQRYSDTLGDLVLDRDGNVIVGYSYQERALQALSATATLVISKLSPAGENLWTYTLPESTAAWMYGIAVDAQGNIYFASRVSSWGPAFIHALDANGQLRWKKELDPVVAEIVSNLSVDPAGDLLAIGGTGIGGGDLPVVVLKLNSQTGDVRWNRTYHTGGLNPDNFLIESLSQGNIAIATSTDADPSTVKVSVLDPMGDEIWSDEWAAVAAAFPHALAVTSDDEIVAVGRVYQETPWILRYSAAGELVVDERLLSEGHSLWSLAFSADGALVLGGSVYTAGHPLGAWLGGFDADLQTTWAFEDALDANAFDRQIDRCSVAPDGDIWVFGKHTLPGDEGLWLARFAGPDGGVPEVGALASEPMTVLGHPAHDGSDVFVDSEVPECEHGGISDYKIVGSIDGAPVDIDGGSSSQLNFSNFAEMVVEDDEVVNAIYLEWEGLAVEGSQMPLVGGYVRLADAEADAFGGRNLCFTTADMGFLPATWDPNPGRMLKFRVSQGFVADDCSVPGEPVTVELRGCVYRTASGL